MSWSSLAEVGLANERVAHLVQRFELLQPAGRRLVQARILDRHRGLIGEHAQKLLVLGGEELGVPLGGQEEVAEDGAPNQDRHAQRSRAGRGIRRR